MTTTGLRRPAPDGITMPVHAKLAALWASVVLLYAYADILALYKPGVIDEILAGRVWELEITQAWAIGALALMAIPISMVFLSVTLPARANRTANVVVASLYALVSVVNAVGDSWASFSTAAAVLEIVVLALVLRYAWRWHGDASSGSSHHAAEPARPSLRA